MELGEGAELEGEERGGQSLEGGERGGEERQLAGSQGEVGCARMTEASAMATLFSPKILMFCISFCFGKLTTAKREKEV